MTKKELGKQIEDAISIWETHEEKPYEEKLLGMKDTIKLCREYIELFKKPYKHSYMGSRIDMSEVMLNEFEKMYDN